MAYKKYTQCYVHTPGDKPFHEDDLPTFVAGAAAPGLFLAIIGAGLLGSPLTAFVGIGVATAQAIVAVADAWLYHRLVCIGPPTCAIGVVSTEPEVAGLGEFDNDEFFDIRLLPHDPDATVAEVQTDGLQGQAFLMQAIDDLPYAGGTTLHAEAEGNFWVKMKEWAVLAGVVAALAAAVGAAVGCAIGSIFGPIGCLIGAILGALLASLLADLLLASIAFNSDPGDVEDTNVGDAELGPIRQDDRIVAVGEVVYDGFHEGWHELHPLMTVQKLGPERSVHDLERMPAFEPDMEPPPPPPGATGLAAVDLTADDMRHGLASARFRARAEFLIQAWCSLLTEALTPATVDAGLLPQHRWTIHPDVDGCEPREQPPEPPH